MLIRVLTPGGRVVKHLSIVVRADWDAEAMVYVATSDDVSGLCLEADSFEAIRDKVLAAIPALLELNGGGPSLPEIPVHIMAQHLSRIPNPCH